MVWWLIRGAHWGKMMRDKGMGGWYMYVRFVTVMIEVMTRKPWIDLRWVWWI